MACKVVIKFWAEHQKELGEIQIRMCGSFACFRRRKGEKVVEMSDRNTLLCLHVEVLKSSWKSKQDTAVVIFESRCVSKVKVGMWA